MPSAIFAALPAMSPTVAFIWHSATRSRLSEPAATSARVRAVDVPVARGRAAPQPRLAAGLVAGAHEEARDRALATLVIAVQDVDADPVAVGDRRAQRRIQRVMLVAQRRLPEAHIACGHIHVA